LKGNAVGSWKEFNPIRWDVPDEIPIGEDVVIWGRRWYLGPSQIHESCGLGLFARQDILLPSVVRLKDRERLLPYCGVVYDWNTWQSLTKASPTFAHYGVSADSYPGRPANLPRSAQRMVDGDPVRCSNIVGYINSSAVPKQLYGLVRHRLVANVEFHYVTGPPPLAPPTTNPRAFDLVVYAICTIHAGDELLCPYNVQGL
jgi:hypothetical protein